MYKAVICDDQKHITDYIERIIEENYYSEINAVSFHTGFAATDYITETAKGNVDIFIVDIDLNGESGIEAAEMIKQSYPHIKVIFITAYIGYATEIFEAEPNFFLVKPLEDDRVIQAIDKTIALIQEERQRCISVVTRGEIRNLQLSQIRYIESKNRTLVIKVKNVNFEVHLKLNEMEQQLPDNFFRCHQSYIVNFDHIRELTPDGATLYSGELVPVSRSKYADTKTSFLKYLGKKI